jgi:hypothetical protein
MTGADRARSFAETGVEAEASHDRAPPKDIPSAKYHAREGEHVSCVNIRDQALQSNSINSPRNQSQCTAHNRCLWSFNLSLAAPWARRFLKRVRTMCLLDDDMLNIGLA